MRFDRRRITAGMWVHDTTAIVNPARLAWGLRAACVEAGVQHP